ncbi:hypothetical protein [Neoaquamicrobium sediminum]|uniref:Uncharacterized protein n=1 Tax=Neoaquamicrobium sediminum TaxID=1849104 RepID=A0ABV3X0T8_9HYPH|nr:hypothetical protein [Mesorhizobium sediminum]NRC56492.1 hypothetical protein [Mesorhizobium sediminum]
MASDDRILAEAILDAFRIALTEQRLQVAEHLLMALERLERDGCCHACPAKAYKLICGDEVTNPDETRLDRGGVSMTSKNPRRPASPQAPRGSRRS